MGPPWLLWVLIVLLPNNGIFPSLKPSGQKMDDFYFLEQEDPEEVLRIIIQLANDPKWFGLDALDYIQVLTPMHKGVVGTRGSIS